MRRLWTILLLAMFTGFTAFFGTFRAGQSPLTPVDVPDSSGILKLEFGLVAEQPREWTGTARVAPGELLSAWGWHFIAPDRIIGSNRWSLSTRLFNDPQERYKGQDLLPAAVLPNGVYVAFRAPDAARFTIDTNHGTFSIDLAELKQKGWLTFLAGDAAATYTPLVRPLTRGEATQHDFPAVAVSGMGVFVSWVAFENDANLVYTAHRAGNVWKVHRVSRHSGDYYGCAVAVDGSRKVHVIWGGYAEDRWRLIARTLDLDSGAWGPEQYVTPAGRRQMFPRMATDAGGTPWLTWQEFAGGHHQIFAAYRRPEGWSEPLEISQSQANHWDPAIAAAPDGSIYIAWDAYERGNYDVFLRSVRGRTPGPVVRVTNAETYDAHPSIAVDPRNRVWLAWEQAGANWGKDWGVASKAGSELHAARVARLVSYENGQFYEPAVPLKEAVPKWLSSMHESPQVAIGPNGVPYVFFRHYLHRIPRPEHELAVQIGSEAQTLQPWYDTVRSVWDIFVTGFDGANWLPVRQLPQSSGRCFMPVAAAVRGDRLLAFWPADGRTYSDPHVKTAQIQFVELETPDRAAPSSAMKPFRSEAGGTPDAAPTERADLERVRAVRWQDSAGGKTLRLFRGDLHRHTDISADSQRDGDIIDTYRYAIDAASLDFLAITDHTGHERRNYFRYDWWRNRQIATLFNNPGHFVAFFAYERTVTYPGGHRNIISTRRDALPFPISDEEFTGVESYGERLFPYLKQKGDIAIPHTTATLMGTDWRENDPKAEPLVEIYQGLRGSYEEPNTPASGRGNQPSGFVWSAWAKGLKLGVIASSDHYSTHESYACVYAPRLTAESVHEALKQRLAYAATDNIVLRFEAVSPDGQVYKMGREFPAPSPPELRVEVEGTGPVLWVELIGNQRILLARTPASSTDKFVFRENGGSDGEAYYYVRVIQQDGQIAWSSPVWVRRGK